MSYSKGIMWLDDCRIPFVDETEKEGVCKSDKQITKDNDIFKGRYNHKRTGGDTKGRFTPNLLVCDNMLNDGRITEHPTRTYNPTKNKCSLFNTHSQPHAECIGDKGTNSRYYDLDLWFDKMLERL